MSLSPFNIKEKVIVVTGATGVLAGSTADYLLRQGATVVYLGRKAERVEAALEKVRPISDKASGYVCDVLDKPRLDEVCAGILEQYGRVDVLINGAGGNMPGATIQPEQSLLDLNLDDYSKVLDLNLKGTLLPTLAFAKTFADQKRGCVVNFSSMTAFLSVTRVLGYSNAKAGVDNLTRWLATEMALRYGEGIRVNAIAPGFFIGKQNRRLLLNEDGTPTQRGQQVLNKTPFGRFGRPDEVHGAIHFLLSDEASFVTGVVLPVDGGFSIYSGV